MQTRLPSALALIVFALAGCSGDGGGEAVAPTTPMPPTLPGVYAGRFPCSNCTAIEATLWLRDDGRFFLRQTFTDDGSASAPSANASTYSLGSWRWDEQAAETVLDGPGPDRRLAVVDAEQLRLLVTSPTPHVLTRDPAAPAFTDRIEFDGESSVSDKGATFKECRTGLQVAVAETGAYKELRRQHRWLNPRGKVTRTQIEGHLAVTPSADGATTSEALVIDRVLTLKPGTTC
jgi:copper homeostasis protein (lipoprotein)